MVTVWMDQTYGRKEAMDSIVLYVSIFFAGVGSVFGWMSFSSIPAQFEITVEYENAYDVACYCTHLATIFFTLALVASIIYAGMRIKSAFH